MNSRRISWKHLVVYVLGLFVLTLGVSFSIYADLGVSPVSSLAYALTLSTGISIGVTFVITNLLYIVVQIFFKRKIDIKDFTVQFIISFLCGFFTDLTLYIVQFLPEPKNLFGQFIYLLLSLFVMPAGIFGCYVSKLPLLPFEALASTVGEFFNILYSKSKVYMDLINVSLAFIICLVSIHSFGAVGIGTVFLAYFTGKVLGKYIKIFKPSFDRWLETWKQSENLLIKDNNHN